MSPNLPPNFSKDFAEKVSRLHPEAALELGSFVLYRSEAAMVIRCEKKQIQLQTSSGKEVRVRPKDILLLSGSRPTTLAEVIEPLGRDDLEEGWQLLHEMGRNCQLLDLAEAVFSGSGPRELYNAFCLVNETPYFKGQAQSVMVRSPEEVREEQERKRRKQQEAERWQRFYQHYQDGSYGDEDQPFIAEIEAIAFGEKSSCRLFQEIRLEATPENAHEWLLRQKLWSERFNPWLRRNQVDEIEPKIEQILSEEERLPWQQLLHDYQAASRHDSPQILEELQQSLSRFCDRQNLRYSTEESTGLWRSETRRNLTHLAAWAIDDPWSHDPDDAISLDGESMWIHIADPASLLPFGSPLATEAMRRGSTVYIPEGSIPMLPRELVQILGLGLQAVSMALSIRVRPPAADPLQTTVEILDLCRSWVRVQRLSYDQADEILQSGQPHSLQQLWQLCQAHERLRQRNQAVHFNMYNTRIVVGEPICIEKKKRK